MSNWETGPLPLWRLDGEFKIGDFDEPTMTGVFEKLDNFDVISYKFFGSATPSHTYPQLSFNWGHNEPEAAKKWSDLDGLFIWQKPHGVDDTKAWIEEMMAIDFDSNQ